MVNDERGEPLLGIVGRWHSLRSAGTEWRHHYRLTEAFERGSTPPDGVGVTFIRARHVSDVPEPSESRDPWLLWIDKPDRKRAEFMVGDELQLCREFVLEVAGCVCLQPTCECYRSEIDKVIDGLALSRRRSAAFVSWT